MKSKTALKLILLSQLYWLISILQDTHSKDPPHKSVKWGRFILWMNNKNQPMACPLAHVEGGWGISIFKS